jgi:8-oxo-dGTP diphosphatase
MKTVHVAVGVVRRGTQVLVARRPANAHQGGLLEFPGGKVEPGEQVQQALVRELEEEIGIAVSPGSLQPLIGIRHDYGDKRVFLDVWESDVFHGDPEGREGQTVKWIAPEQLRDNDFPAANRPIIRALQLPHFYPISGPAESAQALIAHGQSRLDHLGSDWLLLRAPWLDTLEYHQVANSLLPLCEARGIRMMLHGDATRLDSIAGTGLHLPWREAAGLTARPLASGAWLGVSCHSESELAHAAAIGADFATLGPVNSTASHPGAAPLGWAQFAELSAIATVPIYALGGLSWGDVDRARRHGGQGVAGISSWW